MDMVEVPSHWMERFASDPACLAMWARHGGTGEPLPTALAERMQRSERMFWALSTQHQALLALVDLRLHGAGALPPGGVTALVRDVFAEYASIPPPPEHKLQLRFGHLVGYGGGYYAYLYAHALARGIGTGITTRQTRATARRGSVCGGTCCSRGGQRGRGT